MTRFDLIPLFLIVFIVVQFANWGDSLAILWLEDPNTGELAAGRSVLWAVAIGMLIADTAIPSPTTAVIAALGIVYGPFLGAAIGIVGTMAAATVGWALGRFLGRPVARWLVGDALEGGEALFARHGGWIVALSRWAPILPEVVSAVAGVSRMRFGVFLLSALCGVTPFCLAFATVGHLGAGEPVWTLAVSAVAPFALWWLARRAGWARRFELKADD